MRFSVFKHYVLIIFLLFCCLVTVNAENKPPPFKYRWVGNDKWSARSGCNVNISVEDQDGDKYAYFQIWGGYHTFRKLLQPKEYYKQNPDYYALVDGKRVTHQICTSNPDAINEVANNLKRVIREDPDIDIVTLAPNDNRKFCQCEKCEEQDEEGVKKDQLFSRRLLFFYCAVSELVHDEFPDIIVRFGCYDIYARPPEDNSIQIPDNTFPLICHFQKYCLNHPINDPICERNSRFSTLYTAT